MVLIKLNVYLIVQRKKSIFIKELITYINKLDSILFTPISSLEEEEEEEENTTSWIRTDQAKSFKDQKGSGYVNLPILLSKIYTNNSSKELITNIEQLIKNLYKNKQITKQVYNNLIKAITYRNDS